MALTASQLDQLHRTLLDAFTQDEMRQMLRVRMDVDFDHVAAEKGQRDQVWELARWADKEGRKRMDMRWAYLSINRISVSGAQPAFPCASQAATGRCNI